MEIELTPEQENLLSQLANDRGTAAASLASEVVRHYLDDETRFIEAVKLGEEELARGEYLTNEQVGLQLRSSLNLDGSTLGSQSRKRLRAYS